MPEMMTCFVMHGIGKVGMMDKPVPRAGPGAAVVRTTAALVCTSDTHTVAGAIGDRRGLTLGHEAGGVIHELGELAAASGLFRVGQRVAVSAITPCYACDNCQRGYPSQCGGMLGGWKFANLKDGSFAEYFHVNNAAANLAPIPDGLTDEQAAYCSDMLSTGFVAAEHANIPIGGSVAVFSQGPVCLMATVGARLRGAGLVIGVESVPNRVALALKYGCDVVVDTSSTDCILPISFWQHSTSLVPRIDCVVGVAESFPGDARRILRRNSLPPVPEFRYRALVYGTEGCRFDSCWVSLLIRR